MQDTRTQILNKNFEAMRKHGFQGLRTDKVIAGLGITKGAFYHYFPTKMDVGYAIVNEIIAPQYISDWANLVREDLPVIDAIIEALNRIKGYSNPENIHLGCPLNNLIQEMAPLDEGFRDALLNIVDTETQLIARALAHAQQQKQVRNNFNPEHIAVYIISSLEGCYSIAKLFQSYELFCNSFDELVGYVNRLRE
ncbi:TetR family transcriptional regulator [Pedobacter sp. BS3]|uniref:TetR/AcrR family transcriptional regulator n=1 Tax=Pedobacter sp. BS3 TaxID=2567937 RepID=UPI0011EC9595|nr:TetR/AcrR family transcriptional regulator [Pedobacter sp. BS3]TZF82285.1 TetR family transcriptional regulator [Pedobacter sp. BS3]